MLSDQSIELLKTKLTPPRLPESLVWRDDLLAHLSAGLNRKLCAAGRLNWQ